MASVRNVTRLETGNQSSCFLRSVIRTRDETKEREERPLERANGFGWSLCRVNLRGYNRSKIQATRRGIRYTVSSSFNVVLTESRLIRSCIVRVVISIRYDGEGEKELRERESGTRFFF